MKNDRTEHDRATLKEGQDHRAPITPAAHELTPAQLELVAGGGDCKVYCEPWCPHSCFVKR